MRLFLSLFKRYHFTPARWYQFWLPQSGAIGGLIAAALITAIFYLLFNTLPF